jgi:hypothetical protein
MITLKTNLPYKVEVEELDNYGNQLTFDDLTIEGVTLGGSRDVEEMNLPDSFTKPLYAELRRVADEMTAERLEYLHELRLWLDARR